MPGGCGIIASFSALERDMPVDKIKWNRILWCGNNREILLAKSPNINTDTTWGRGLVQSRVYNRKSPYGFYTGHRSG